MRLFAFVIALPLALAACGGQVVHPLGLHDPRLPTDARRWVADAEDAVAVARAWRETTQADLESVQQWNHRLVATAWPPGAESAAAARELSALAEARLRLARLEAELAEADLTLAEAKLVQVQAETAMRHDLAVYDLEPIHDDTKAARARVASIRQALEAQQRAMEAASASWWKAYAAYLAKGGKAEALWVKP